ncbi:MAG: DUF982 domain-containing protein [Mesorhizobium sp.]
MSTFLPLRIRFVDGSSMVVTSTGGAEKALAGQWPNKNAHLYKQAERLLGGVREGTCKPSVAFEAFKRAAAAQRLLQPCEMSRSLVLLDSLTSASCR